MLFSRYNLMVTDDKSVDEYGNELRFRSWDGCMALKQVRVIAAPAPFRGIIRFSGPAGEDVGVVWLGGDRCSLVLSSLLASRVGARIVYLSVALVLYCFNTDRCAMYCVLYVFLIWNPEPHGRLLADPTHLSPRHPDRCPPWPPAARSRSCLSCLSRAIAVVPTSQLSMRFMHNYGRSRPQ